MMAGRPRKEIDAVSVARFSSMVDELKASRHVSQIELAKRVGISQQAISKIKSGDVCLAVDLAKTFEMEFPEYSAVFDALVGIDGRIDALEKEDSDRIVDEVREYYEFLMSREDTSWGRVCEWSGRRR